MTLKLMYIIAVSTILLLTLVVFRVTIPHPIVREIHHYSIHDAAVKSIMKDILYEHMQEILYGYKYKEPIFPAKIYFWWQESPYNLFGIFPDGFTNYYYGNQEPMRKRYK